MYGRHISMGKPPGIRESKQKRVSCIVLFVSPNFQQIRETDIYILAARELNSLKFIKFIISHKIFPAQEWRISAATSTKKWLNSPAKEKILLAQTNLTKLGWINPAQDRGFGEPTPHKLTDLHHTQDHYGTFMMLRKARTRSELTALPERWIRNFIDPGQPLESTNKHHLALGTEITEFLECHDTAFHSTLFMDSLASLLFPVSRNS